MLTREKVSVAVSCAIVGFGGVAIYAVSSSNNPVPAGGIERSARAASTPGATLGPGSPSPTGTPAGTSALQPGGSAGDLTRRDVAESDTAAGNTLVGEVPGGTALDGPGGQAGRSGLGPADDTGPRSGQGGTSTRPGSSSGSPGTTSTKPATSTPKPSPKPSQSTSSPAPTSPTATTTPSATDTSPPATAPTSATTTAPATT